MIHWIWPEDRPADSHASVSSSEGAACTVSCTSLVSATGPCFCIFFMVQTFSGWLAVLVWVLWAFSGKIPFATCCDACDEQSLFSLGPRMFSCPRWSTRGTDPSVPSPIGSSQWAKRLAPNYQFLSCFCSALFTEVSLFILCSCRSQLQTMFWSMHMRFCVFFLEV